LWYIRKGFSGNHVSGSTKLEKKTPLENGKTMILFIEKTWFLWWMLLMALGLRWFHVLSLGPKMKDRNAPNPEEEEQAYMTSWRILHKARAISLTDTRSIH
jgi:hypothetical protein